MKLIIDWINICPDDFQQSAFRREFIEFLNRVSAMGEQYRWFCEEIRYQAIINVTNLTYYTHHNDFIFILKGIGNTYRDAIYG